MPLKLYSLSSFSQRVSCSVLAEVELGEVRMGAGCPPRAGVCLFVCCVYSWRCQRSFDSTVQPCHKVLNLTSAGHVCVMLWLARFGLLRVSRPQGEEDDKRVQETLGLSTYRLNPQLARAHPSLFLFCLLFFYVNSRKATG